jgi:hypothetical protein
VQGSATDEMCNGLLASLDLQTRIVLRLVHSIVERALAAAADSVDFILSASAPSSPGFLARC